MMLFQSKTANFVESTLFVFSFCPRSNQTLEQLNISISYHRHSPASFGIVPTITVSSLELTFLIISYHLF